MAHEERKRVAIWTVAQLCFLGFEIHMAATVLASCVDRPIRASLGPTTMR